MALPLDLAIRAYLTAGRIFHFRQLARMPAGRPCSIAPEFAWPRLHGPVVNKALSNLLQGAWLPALGSPWRGGGGVLQRRMQVFMPPILQR
jgi:hypothetical protein